MILRIPLATYRLQFNGDFTFAEAEGIVEYLRALGVSHCYTSPLLKSRSGSLHGYDIVDHNSFNPEIGERSDFNRLTDTLRSRGMGLIMDIVPNHMGVGGGDNHWWLDVLEHGPDSPYAAYFDIDWHPANQRLYDKLLLPLLDDHYGAVLEGGRLKLVFEPDAGALSVYYFKHRFPIDPATYSETLRPALEHLKRALPDDPSVIDELQQILRGLDSLPERAGGEPATSRSRDADMLKRWLAALCARAAPVGEAIEAEVAVCNGTPGRSGSFDRLHRLLEMQAYRLAFWRVAADEINYRRFFDINDLAGLRMENPEVFQDTHQFTMRLVGERRVDGLRIDHPDGLYDPAEYYRRLCDAVSSALTEAPIEPDEAQPPVYVVAEKILAPYEFPHEEWPINGTTGYDYINLATGVLIDPDAEKAVDRIYTNFIRERMEPDELLYQCKKLIITTTLTGELTVLANQLKGIAEANRYTRDYTLNGLRDALREIAAFFPVYRTYVTLDTITEQDRDFVDWAVAQAKKRDRAGDLSVYDFVRSILVLEHSDTWAPAYTARAARFTMRFQQYTAPLMAKAMEDTMFYVYNRFAALNEVGGDPRRFGASVAAFHHANKERLRHWPHAMLASSTHDTKRSGDVRARLAVLSEMPAEWRRMTSRWRRVNRSRKRQDDGIEAPNRNDEYLFYQTLLGAWPLQAADDGTLTSMRERIKVYMLKAIREAKTNTSWTNPNAAYEDAVAQFVDAVLSGDPRNKFLDEFLPFQKRVAFWGLYNSLSATLLKLAAPGVPDIYQGDEIWDFTLVDPDNRRAVDFDHRRALLDNLQSDFGDAASPETAQRATALLDNLEDGRAKLYVIWRTLALRRERPQLFQSGEYLALETSGQKADHLCAFARRSPEGEVLVAIAPRLYASLTDGNRIPPLGRAIWNDTYIELPTETGRHSYVNLFTGTRLRPAAPGAPLAVAEALRDFPLGLLLAC